MLRTNVCGVEFRNPLMLAAGVMGSNASSMNWILKSGAAGVVSKSFSLEPNPGYANPTTVGVECGIINAIGLSNPGAENFKEELKRIDRKGNVSIASIYGATPEEFSKLVLEIEDYMMYDKMDQVKLNLLRLRDLGFRISVDGLKLDYAALSQIEKEPIDIIKLDRSFLKDINNNKMKEKFVEMLVDSAEHMHRMVIAEGVEVYDHILYLEKNNIQYGQGYYFSKPFEDKFVYEFIVNKDFEDKLDLKHANLVANNLSEAKEVETLQEKANTQKQVDDEGSSDNITM